MRCSCITAASAIDALLPFRQAARRAAATATVNAVDAAQAEATPSRSATLAPHQTLSERAIHQTSSSIVLARCWLFAAAASDGRRERPTSCSYSALSGGRGPSRRLHARRQECPPGDSPAALRIPDVRWFPAGALLRAKRAGDQPVPSAAAAAPVGGGEASCSSSALAVTAEAMTIAPPAALMAPLQHECARIDALQLQHSSERHRHTVVLRQAARRAAAAATINAADAAPAEATPSRSATIAPHQTPSEKAIHQTSSSIVLARCWLFAAAASDGRRERPTSCLDSAPSGGRRRRLHARRQECPPGDSLAAAAVCAPHTCCACFLAACCCRLREHQALCRRQQQRQRGGEI